MPYFAAEYNPMMGELHQAAGFNFYENIILTPKGHGLLAGISGSTSGIFTASVQGQIGLLCASNYGLQGFGMYEKTFSYNFLQAAPDVAGVGIKCQHISGLNVIFSGSYPIGTPFRTVGITFSIPLDDEGNIRLGATLSNTFGGGVEPQNHFGVTVSHFF